MFKNRIYDINIIAVFYEYNLPLKLQIMMTYCLDYDGLKHVADHDGLVL